MPDQTTPPAAPPPPPSIPQAEIDSGKTMAILSYLPVGPVGLIISIVCVAQKNNAYSLYHAKQALTLWIIAAVAYVVSVPLIFACGIGALLMAVAGIGTLVLAILGIIAANKGECKELPVIGKFADKWFGKIQKA